ncbi:MAG: hypothetical protein ACRDKI_05935 [Solirubrobacterales bacterium]
MSDRRRMLIVIAAIFLIAVVITMLPSGPRLQSVIDGTISALFYGFGGLALARWYKSRPLWLTTLPDRERIALYGAGSIALLARIADERFQTLGNSGKVIEWSIIIACGVLAFMVWRDAQRNAF